MHTNCMHRWHLLAFFWHLKELQPCNLIEWKNGFQSCDRLCQGLPQVRNKSFHGLIMCQLLPKYTTCAEAHTHTHCSNPLHVQHILHLSPPPSSPATLLFNILAQYIRVGIRLHIQVGPLDCSLGMLGRGRREKKQSQKKKKSGADGKKVHNNNLFPCVLGPAG